MNIKKLIKFISALLIFTFIMVNILSCNNSEADNNIEKDNIDAQPPDVTETEEVLPSFDFDNYEFTILNMIQAEHYYMNMMMEVEGEIGEPINDAAYKRSREIEGAFNIKFREINASDTLQMSKKEFLSGADTYDLAMLIDREAMTLAQQNLVARIDEMPNIQLDKPWWDQNAREVFSIGGKLFSLPGGYQLSNLDLTRFVLFNKQILADIEGEDLYQLVRDGKWTFDKLISIAKQNSRDLNGDGIYDENDAYGLISVAHHLSLGIFFYGSGESFIKKDNDDMPYFAMPGNERAVMVYQKIVDELYSGNYYFCTQVTKDNENIATALFSGNHALFYAISLNRIPKFRDMDSPFGILPPPKFNEAQDRYYCESGGGLIGVAYAGSENLTRTGAVWDAYSQLSYKYVVPAYFEVSLKTKFTRDIESENMLDLIYKNLWYDLGNVYWWEDIISKYNDIFVKKDTNIVSATEKINDKVDKIISDYISSFTDTND